MCRWVTNRSAGVISYTQINTSTKKVDLWGGNGHLSAMQPHTWRAMAAIGVLLTIHNFTMFAGSRDNFVPGSYLG